MSTYDFASPGAAAVDEMTAGLLEREKLKRQAMLDELQRQQVESQIKDREANRRIQEENVAGQREAREALADERKQKQIAGVTSLLSPGQDISGTEAASVLPGYLQRTEGGATLPSKQISDAGVKESPSQSDASVPTRQVFMGTPQQIGMKNLADKMRQATEGGKPMNRDQITQAVIDTGVPLAEAGKVVDELTKHTTQSHSYIVDAKGKVVNTLDITGDKDETHVLPNPRADADAGGGMSGLSPQAKDMAAAQIAKTGNWQSLRSLGMGNISHADKIEIMNRAAQFDTATNTFKGDPGLGAPNLAGNAATTKANEAALKDLTQNTAAVESFAQTAKYNRKIFDDIKDDIPDWGNQWLNKPVRWVASSAGSTAMTRLDVVRQSLQSEYGRLISQAKLSGAPLTDSARKDIDAGLGANATVHQFETALDTLEREGANRDKAFNEQIAKTRGALGGATVGGSKPTVDDIKKKHGLSY
jgi:hypothetical protein